MSPSVGMVLINFEQKWSFMTQTNKQVRRLLNLQMLQRVDIINYWF